MTKLVACPITLKQANEFVEKYHRHHVSVNRDKFRVGCMSSGEIVGVAQVARPVSRILDDGETCEVVRLCVKDNQQNVCSFLYSRCARIAKEMGYKKIITYILASESGTSLKASGWHYEANTEGRTWDTPARTRTLEKVDLFGNTKKYPTQDKQRWSKEL